MKIGALIVAGVLLAVAGSLILASLAWRRATRRERDRIVAGAAVPGSPAAADAAVVPPSVPTPVARFLARTGPADGRAIRTARIEQEGEFLLKAPDGWAPFTATQLFRADPPAFLWDARIRMAPFVPVRVRDSYIDGVGSMHGAVAGLVTVVRAGGTPEMAEGSLYRFLAEAAWLPTRLRPSATLRWDAVDDSTAVATLTDAGLSVSVRFTFDVDGDITSIYVPERAREVDGAYEMAPWVGRFRDPREVGGIRIPTRGEVAWVLDGEERPYWKGRIVQAAYDFR